MTKICPERFGRAKFETFMKVTMIITMKKQTLLMLCLSAVCMITACADAKDGTAVTAADTTAPDTAAITVGETEDIAVADVPADADFSGHTFTFLVTGNTENNWQKNDFLAPEETGDVLGDARFRRNLAVEERFGIKIETDEQYGQTKGAGSGYLTIEKCVMAGDTAYDAGMIAGYDCATLACAGMLYDLCDMPYIDLSQRWWDQRVNEDLTINGKLYYTTGDISTADNDATGAILFNKKIVEDYDLPDPYALVRDGKWTISAMVEMGRGIAADLNGDAKYDKNDRYAAIVWDDTMMGIINAAGVKCATVGDDGKLSLTFYNDRLLSMFEQYRDAYYDDTQAYAYQRVSYDITDPVSMFSNDQSLFFFQLLDLVTYFRDMKTDFGILPLPKLDEQQERYYSTIGSWHSVFLCAPAVQEDAERTGIILEALAAESYNTVTPAYYEKTLVGKYIRDEESEEMLDIILSSHVYDLGWFYQVGKYCDEVLYMWMQKDEDMTLRYERREKVAHSDIERINEAFAQLDT